jgi:hypothetical protein
MTSVHREDTPPIGRQVTPTGAGHFSYDLPGGELPHQHITFGLNKMAGWAVELAARNLKKP